jgi:hypothetical protein
MMLCANFLWNALAALQAADVTGLNPGRCPGLLQFKPFETDSKYRQVVFLSISRILPLVANPLLSRVCGFATNSNLQKMTTKFDFADICCQPRLVGLQEIPKKIRTSR